MSPTGCIRRSKRTTFELPAPARSRVKRTGSKWRGEIPHTPLALRLEVSSGTKHWRCELERLERGPGNENGTKRAEELSSVRRFDATSQGDRADPVLLLRRMSEGRI